MATYSRIGYAFDGAATIPPDPIGDFLLDSNNAVGLSLKRDGAGKVTNPDNANGYYSYAVTTEPQSDYKIGILFTVPASIYFGWKAGVCVRHKKESATVSIRKGFDVEVGAGLTGGVGVYRGGVADLFAGTTLAAGTYWFVADVKKLVTANTTRVSYSIFTAAGFDKDDYDNNTPTQTQTVDVTDAELYNPLGSGQGFCGFYSHSEVPVRTPTDWAIQEAAIWTEIFDTDGPVLTGGTCERDGKGISLMFTDQSLPLDYSSGAAVTGLTLQTRVGFSGAWTTVAKGAATIHHDVVKFNATTAIPRTHSIRVIYDDATGNIVDGLGNDAVSKTVDVANFSRIQTAARTWTKQRCIATGGVTGVYGGSHASAPAGASGYEAQATREMVLPYGCSAAGFRLVYEKCADGDLLTIRIKAAGVRLVRPDGTVATATVLFSGSGTVDVTTLLGVVASDLIPGAHPPGTLLYVTTFYKEAAGGSLFYQFSEGITERHATTGDGNGFEAGLIDALTNKVLLGGTPSGPGHDYAVAGGRYGNAVQGRCVTYGPAYVEGLPYEYYSGTDRASGWIGNSLMGYTMNSIGGTAAEANSVGDLNARPYVIMSVGGGLADTALTAITTGPVYARLLGADESDCRLTEIAEWYGVNTWRTSGRPTFGPDHLVDLLWGHVTSFAAISLARGMTHIVGTQSPVKDSSWFTWPLADWQGVRSAIAVYQHKLLASWQSIPGVSAVMDISPYAGSSYQNNWPGDNVNYPGHDFLDWQYIGSNGGGDGIHGFYTFGAGAGMLFRAKFDELAAVAEAAAEGGGGGGGSVGSRQLRRGRN